MIIKQAEFVISAPKISQCPPADRAEFAFIGRSNVGKSSLINMLTNRKSLAKTSSTPGKTQLINHFIINNEWYLVDLPGYGYARVSQKDRANWQKMIKNYLLQRENLLTVFVLIDSRHEPQKIDLEFINFLGENSVPLQIILTKTDKQNNAKTQTNLNLLKNKLLESWDECPNIWLSSSQNKEGKEEVLNEIESIINQYWNN